MCTVTWLREGEGFTLLFSRDELTTRAPALGPVVHDRGGLGILAPIDPEGGGTWLAVNQAGLALGLVNGNPPQDGSRLYRSRGLLVLDLSGARTASEVSNRLGSADLASFRPFTLLVLDPRLPARIVRWDGTALELHDGEGEAILCSAPHEHEELEPARAAAFRQRLSQAAPTAADLARFHESHAAPPGTRPPCLHGDRSRTVSFTTLRVDPAAVELRYRPGNPCLREPEERLMLPRI